MKTILIRITTILIVSGLLFSALGVQTAQAATTLINTLGLPWTGDVAFDSFYSEAQSFVLNTTRRITSVTLNLYTLGGGPSGNYTVSLHNEAASTPGSLITTIGSGTLASLATDNTGQVAFTGLNIIVTANRSYFVVVTSDSIDAIYWGTTDNSLCGTGCASGFPSYFSEKFAGTWSPGSVLAPLRLNVVAEQVACTWTAGAGTNAWATAANWDCGLAPIGGDAATVGAAAPAPVISANAVLDSLTIPAGGSVVVNSGVTLTGLTSITVASGGSFTFSGATGNIRSASVTNNGTITQIQDVPFGGATTFAIRNSISQDTYPMLVITPDTTGLGTVTLQVRGNQACSTVDSTVHRCFDISTASPQAATVRFWYLNSEKAAQIVASMAAYHAGAGPVWQALTLATTPRGTLGLWEWVEAVNVSTFSPFVLASSAPTAVTLLNLEARPASQNIAWVVLGGAVLLAGLGLLARRKLARH